MAGNGRYCSAYFCNLSWAQPLRHSPLIHQADDCACCLHQLLLHLHHQGEVPIWLLQGAWVICKPSDAFPKVLAAGPKHSPETCNVMSRDHDARWWQDLVEMLVNCVHSWQAAKVTLTCWPQCDAPPALYALKMSQPAVHVQCMLN
jgi:hypothetical protein